MMSTPSKSDEAEYFHILSSKMAKTKFPKLRFDFIVENSNTDPGIFNKALQIVRSKFLETI